jgi:hypothetical protein
VRGGLNVAVCLPQRNGSPQAPVSISAGPHGTKKCALVPVGPLLILPILSEANLASPFTAGPFSFTAFTAYVCRTVERGSKPSARQPAEKRQMSVVRALAANGTCGSIVAGVPLGPKGSAGPVGCTGCSRRWSAPSGARGRASALLPTSPSMPGRPNAAAGSSLVR